MTTAHHSPSQSERRLSLEDVARRWSESVEVSTIERNQAIRMLRADGASLGRIAVVTSLGKTTIRHICREDV